MSRQYTSLVSGNMLVYSAGTMLERQWRAPYGIASRLLRVRHLFWKASSKRGRGVKAALARTMRDHGQPAMIWHMTSQVE